MSWRQKIAIVVLMILAALPVAGMVCAMTCLPDSTAAAAAAAAHHGSGEECERPTPASSTGSNASNASKASAVSDASPDCRNHSGSLPQVAATAPQRADLAVISAQVASDPVDPLFGRVGSFESLFQYSPPLRTAPPTAMPLVLRI